MLNKIKNVFLKYKTTVFISVFYSIVIIFWIFLLNPINYYINLSNKNIFSFLSFLNQYNPKYGIGSIIFKYFKETYSLSISIVLGIKSMVSTKEITTFVIIISFVIWILFYLFVVNPLRLSLRYYFIENSTKKTPSYYFLRGYCTQDKIKKYIILALRDILILLFSPTVILSVVIYYKTYFLTDYLAITNKIDNKELKKTILKFSISKDLFLFDIKFLLLNIVSIISFGVINIFILLPLRQNKKTELLKKQTFYFKSLESRSFSKFENNYYNKHYSYYNLVLIFFVVAFFGWLWEVILYLFDEKAFINRGFLHGPYLPIYGFGTVCIILLFKKLSKKPFFVFLVSGIFASIIEYITSFALEKIYDKKWWNYGGFFLNLNSRICLNSFILFGVGGLLSIYFIAPILNKLFNKCNKNILKVIAIIIIIIILVDFIYSAFISQNVGNRITS